MLNDNLYVRQQTNKKQSQSIKQRKKITRHENLQKDYNLNSVEEKYEKNTVILNCQGDTNM